MTGFKPQTSGIWSNCSANWSTTNSQAFVCSLFWPDWSLTYPLLRIWRPICPDRLLNSLQLLSYKVDQILNPPIGKIGQICKDELQDRLQKYFLYKLRPYLWTNYEHIIGQNANIFWPNWKRALKLRRYQVNCFGGISLSIFQSVIVMKELHNKQIFVQKHQICSKF